MIVNIIFEDVLDWVQCSPKSVSFRMIHYSSYLFIGCMLKAEVQSRFYVVHGVSTGCTFFLFPPPPDLASSMLYILVQQRTRT